MDPKTVKCNFCCKVFSRKCNLYQHMKNVHKRNSQGHEIVVHKFSCVLCNKSYDYKSNLQRHKDSVHKHPSGEVDKPKEELIVRSFKCSKCNAKYKHKNSVTRHERKAHKIYKSSFKKKTCPICKYKAKKEDMYIHFKSIHGICVKSERFNFNSMEDFFRWKKEIEKRTVSMFSKNYSTPNIVFYECNRCGFYNEPRVRKRHLKLTGTCKINGFCPAMMKTKKLKSDIISVLYISTHVGHRNELKHLQLSKNDRKNIAALLASKAPHQEVLKTIRNSVKNSELERIHLTTKSDLRNIELSYNLNGEAIKNQYDLQSVEAWVTKLKVSKDTALLVYKPQYVVSDEFPQLKEEDFLFIYMTEAQKSILQKYGNDIVSIDGTHGLNNYKFQLYTVLTMDETREGFPAIFMFSNRGDETIFEIFFSKIKNVLGCITPNTFMSDMEDTFYSAWSKTMGPSKNRVYCTWHVLKAWRKNLQNKIKIKEKRDSVLKMLQALLYELDEVAFKRMLDEALRRMRNDQETNLFSSYFQDNYVNKDKYRYWAYCYRINASVNTNMSLENFHKVLKYFYLKGKNVRRLDKALCAILNIIKDKLFDLIIKFEKGKLVTKLKILRNRHKASFSLDADKILTDVNDTWQVLSSTELYTVRRIKQCTSCNLQCSHCNSCFHEFVCSCMDNAIKNNMCKHIHLICRTLVDSSNTAAQLHLSPTLRIDIEEEDKQVIVTAVVDEISNNEKTLSLQEKKKKMTEKFNLIEKMAQMEEDIDVADKFLDKLIKKLKQRAQSPRPKQEVHTAEKTYKHLYVLHPGSHVKNTCRLRKIKLNQQRVYLKKKCKKEKKMRLRAQ